MLRAVYNSAIPDAIRKPVTRALRFAPSLGICVRLSFSILALSAAWAADWSGPEQQLARKIAAVTGPGAVALTVENRSSLGQRDSEIIQNGLRSALEAAGLRFVKAEQAAATVTITLSENPSSLVWVAQIRQGTADTSVVLVSAPRPEGASSTHDAVPLSLRKTSLWAQESPILDVAVLEENSTPTHLAVLDPEKVSLYRLQGGKWQQEQALPITHERPWPRDLRGLLIPAGDHLLDAYLPGVICASTAAVPLTFACRESDDPWPLVAAGLSSGNVFPPAGTAAISSAIVPRMKAFFAPTRNFFTGALTPGVGKFTTVPKFYSAAPLPRDKYTLWLFATTDGQMHMVDGVSDQVARFGWSSLTTLKTLCGAGWQVLASSSGEQAEDSARAYEFPDRDPVAVSAPIDLPGRITALWTESRGDTAVVVVKDRETESYEAFRLAVACSQ